MLQQLVVCGPKLVDAISPVTGVVLYGGKVIQNLKRPEDTGHPTLRLGVWAPRRIGTVQMKIYNIKKDKLSDHTKHK